MKKAFLWLTTGVLLLVACQLPFIPIPAAETATPALPTVEPVPNKPELTSGEDEFALFREGLVQSQQAALDGLSGASMYSIELTIRDDILNTNGIEEVRYTNRETVPLEEVHFRLLPNVLNGEMKVASVRVNDQPFEPIYELQNSLMRVPLYEPLQPGESVEIKIEFSVTVPAELESNYGILAYYNGVLTLAHSYPMIAVYDDEGWNAEIPPDQGDPTYADASFFVVKVDAPGDLVLVGSGRETNREANGSRQIVMYVAGPARDFYLAASPDYEVTSTTVGEVTYNSYAPAGLEGGAEMALDVAIKSIEFFGGQYAPYPYTEFDIVSTPTYALGIEYPGIVAITDRIYDLDGNLSGNPNSVIMESTVAHEAGHQWFYNLVGNDQLDEPWLDESLTQFVTWEYFANRYGVGGASGFEQSLRGRWERVDNQPLPIGMPVADYEGSAYSAIIYGRGAFFFEALREELGEEDFSAFMKDYVTSNSWGIGTGENMKELAEDRCNCDLTALYVEWVSP
ncbi:MAG: M1 family metallopeptidase [Anaerolineales bacterium]|nr:M1 family metallopeptidase [Anaerolineales bacterium]